MQPSFQANNNMGGAPGQKPLNIGGMEINAANLQRQSMDHLKNKVMIVDDVDRQVWELVTNVPRINKILSYVCAFLNFILPGSGTLIAACAAHDNVSKAQLMIAFLQFMLGVVIIGWVWSIYWGYLLVMKAQKDESQVNRYAGQPSGTNPGMNYAPNSRGQPYN